MLSVLLSVYAGEKPLFLEQALESIWDHQKVRPNQIVLVQDGEVPLGLAYVINRWKKRLGDVLTLVILKENQGLGVALNEGLKFCKHDLVARMDTDDVSLPERFAKQIEFMTTNPSVAASSAIIEEWDYNLKDRLSQRNLPIDAYELAKFAVRRSPLSHPVSIYRKAIVVGVGGYPPLRKSQDYALWSLLLVSGYKLGNVDSTLLKMRAGQELMVRRGFSYFRHELDLLKYQKSIGFLSKRDFVVNLSLKALLRMSPNFIKQLAYKLAR